MTYAEIFKKIEEVKAEIGEINFDLTILKRELTLYLSGDFPPEDIILVMARKDRIEKEIKRLTRMRKCYECQKDELTRLLYSEEASQTQECTIVFRELDYEDIRRNGIKGYLL